MTPVDRIVLVFHSIFNVCPKLTLKLRTTTTPPRPCTGSSTEDHPHPSLQNPMSYRLPLRNRFVCGHEPNPTSTPPTERSLSRPVATAAERNTSSDHLPLSRSFFLLRDCESTAMTIRMHQLVHSSVGGGTYYNKLQCGSYCSPAHFSAAVRLPPSTP